MTVNFKLLCDMDGNPDILIHPVKIFNSYKNVGEFVSELTKIANDLMKEHSVCYCVKCTANYKNASFSLIANA